MLALAGPVFNFLPWGRERERCLLCCCSATNTWSRPFSREFSTGFSYCSCCGLPHCLWLAGSGSSRASHSPQRASPASGGIWPSLLMILVIICLWLLLKLSMTFYTHLMRRAPYGWVTPEGNVRMGLFRRMTFQGFPCFLFVNLH